MSVKDLGFSYTKDKKVLTDISFDVRMGEMMSIVGKNGAGKSTLAGLICGFNTPGEGTILLNGKDISPLSIKERGEHIGYVMQNPNQMLVKDIIETFCQRRNKPLIMVTHYESELPACMTHKKFLARNL